MEIKKMLTISSEHIKPGTAELLQKWTDWDACGSEPDGVVVYPKEKFGWFVYFLYEEINPNKIPEDLAACFELAKANGCEILCLDGDAEPLSGLLPSYLEDWNGSESNEKDEPAVHPFVSFEDVQSFAKKYGFTARRHEHYPERYSICARNTDDESTEWFWYNKVDSTIYVRGNTDHLNIWLRDTRPDLTAELCIQMITDLNALFRFLGESRFKISTLIDPEDWQDIANVPDAFEDPRYTDNI